MASEVEIGIWVEGVQKWVTGVTRRTTCHDVIKALLRAQNQPAQDSDVSNYVIVERWRKVEKPLDHEQRILKVWKTWGEAVQEVRFTLRIVREEGERMDSEAESRTERSRRRLRWKNSHSHNHHHHSTGLEKQSKKSSKDNSSLSEAMDRLMRLVLAQGETIQTQIRRLQERDQQIETYEQQMHLLRVKSIGSDYLVHSYLRDPSGQESQRQKAPRKDDTKDDLTCEETSNDSGVITEEALESSSTPIKKNETEKLPVEVTDEVDEVRLRVSALERLEDVLKSLIEQEVYLHELESSLEEAQNAEVTDLEEQLTQLSKIHSQTVAEARQNDTHLRELDTVLYHRKSSLETLTEEEVKLDEELMALEAHLDFIIHLPPSAFNLTFEEAISKSFEKTAAQIENATNSEQSSTASEEKKTNSSNNNSSFIKDSPKSPKIKRKTEEIVKLQINTEAPPPLPSSSPPPLKEESNLITRGIILPTEIRSNSSSSSSSNSSTGSNSCSSSSSYTSCSTVPNDSSNDVCKKRTSSNKKCLDATKDNDSTDSNSDTGLSSLHSSSDEGVIYSLDTLV